MRVTCLFECKPPLERLACFHLFEYQLLLRYKNYHSSSGFEDCVGASAEVTEETDLNIR